MNKILDKDYNELENDIRQEIIDNILKEFKTDYVYKFCLQKNLSKEMDSLEYINKYSILETINSLADSGCSSLYEAIHYKIKEDLICDIIDVLNDELMKYKEQSISLSKYKNEIYKAAYNLYQEKIEEIMREFFSKERFISNDLYKIGCDIVTKINDYNEIMKKIKSDILDTLSIYKCSDFEIKYVERRSFRASKSITLDDNNEWFKVNYCLKDFILTDTIDGFNIYSNVYSKINLYRIKDLDILYKFKVIYNLPVYTWNKLYNCAHEIITLQDEQLEIIESIRSSRN